MITRGTRVHPSSLSSIRSHEPSRPPDLAPPLAPEPPRWVVDLMAGADLQESDDIQILTTGELAMLTTVIARARLMDADRFRAAVAHAYAALGETLRSLHRRSIRWWNYLPNPAETMVDGLDRYMVFNAGRRDGFERSSRGTPVAALAATAAAVGVASDDLVIQCLSSRAGGDSVENPRQKPAWQYSARYGPVPPTFCRATTTEIGGRRLLVIGGTASVVGEDSIHVGNLKGQLDETFCNLTALVTTALETPEEPGHALTRMTDVRVYLTPDQPASTVHAAVRARSPRARIELATAMLCRPELLVEIEAVAEL